MEPFQLRKKMKNLAVYLFGNKVSLFSASAFLAGSCLTIDTEIEARLEEKLHEKEKSVFVSPSDDAARSSAMALFGIDTTTNKEVNAMEGIFSILGLYGLAATSFGFSTSENYHRTMDHIRSRGKLEPRYLEKLIERTGNKKFVGYCQLQGAYLAARESGQLDIFRDVKRKSSRNCLPNF